MVKINKVTKDIKSVKGLTTKSILEMDVYKLNTASLRKVVSRLVSSANKRIRRLQQKNIPSQALRRHNEQFSLKGIGKTDRNSLEMLMKDIKNFMLSESSTIKGYQAQRQRLEEKLGTFESVEEENDFWNVYNDWVDKHPNLASRFNNSTQIRSMMYDEFIVKGKTPKGAKSSITKALNKMLKEQNAKDEEKDAVLRDALKGGRKDVFKLQGDF